MNRRIFVFLLTFLSFLNLNFAQDPFAREVEVEFTDKGAFSFDVVKPQFDVNLHLGVEVHLQEGEQISLVILYGVQSETIILSKKETTKICLCHNDTSHFNAVYILFHSFKSKDSNKVTIKAKWEDLALKLGSSKEVHVSPTKPATFLIDHDNEKSTDRFILSVDPFDLENYDETNEICMIVAVYDKQCPLHNKVSNVKSAQMWTTALKSATLTIRADKFCFKDDFYVSVVIVDNENCFRRINHGDNCTKYANHNDLLNVAKYSSQRGKNVSIRVDKIMPYAKYVTPILVVIVAMLFLIGISYCIIYMKSYGDITPETVETANKANDEEESIEMNGIEVHDCVDGHLKDEAASDLCRACNEAIEGREEPRKKRLRKGFNRMRDQPKVADNKILREDVWFRRNRSRVYIYLVPLISIFYFVPAIQFAFQAKENEEMTGSLDLCYHNFKCARPLWIFSDFNHVISNISYLFFGIFFMHLAFIKTKQLPPTNHPRNDHESNTGLLQQMSIFYAMGFSLMAQGFFSVCYHVCPTNLSLQFDTTMMYVICILCYVKLFQFRHPDATANAYSTFGLLGLVVFLEACALYSSSWIVYGLFLASYISLTVFIAFDAYYLGIGRTDYLIALALAKDIVSNWKPVRKPTEQDEVDAGRVRKLLRPLKAPSWVKYPRRLLFATIFVSLNFLYAIYIVYQKVKDPEKNITHVVLNILAGNLVLYLVYYLIRKKCCKTTESEYLSKNKSWRCRNEDGKIVFPSLISPGTFFAVLALAFGLTAINFYAKRSANRNLTPAESRNLNAECTLFDFYDNHDLWHFFSGAAIFMAFLALLTVDDDLLFVPRDKIDVF